MCSSDLRLYKPQLLMPVDWKIFVENLNTTDVFDLKLVAWEGERQCSLKQILDMLVLKKLPKPYRIRVVIGPEGGLSEAEVFNLKDQGFQSFTLGETVLRVENAGLVIAANIQYALGDGR